MSVFCTCFGGRVVKENRGDGAFRYVADGLGSTVAMTDLLGHDGRLRVRVLALRRGA